MVSSKNFGLSPAAVDLGLGDALRFQLEDAELERKKKLLAEQRAQKMSGGAYGPATQSLYAGTGSMSLGL